MAGPFGNLTPVMAENYGVSAVSADNAPALRQALSGRGRVTLTVPGTYSVGSTVLIGSHTELSLGAGVVLQLGNGVNAPVIRNTQAQSYLAAAAFTFSGGTWTVVEQGHSRTIGSQVWLEQLTGSTGITAGPVTVTAVSGDTWSYAGTTATITGYVCVGYYYPIAGSAITIASGFATVSEPNHTRMAGDVVYMTGFTAATGSVNGIQEIAWIGPGYWVFATTATGAVTGTGNILGENNIGIGGEGIIDGNNANNPGGATMYQGVTVWLGNLSKLRLPSIKVHGAPLRCISTFNISDVVADSPLLQSTHVGWQVEGAAKRLSIRDARGYAFLDALPAGANADDFIAFTRTEQGVSGYDLSLSPSGVGPFDECSVIGAHPVGFSDVTTIIGNFGPTSRFKLRDIGGECIQPAGTVSGTLDENFLGVKVDDGLSAVGTIIGTLVIDNVDVQGNSQGLACVGIRLGSGGKIGKCSIRNLNWDTSMTYALWIEGLSSTSNNGTIQELNIDGIHTVAANTLQTAIEFAAEPTIIGTMRVRDAFHTFGSGSCTWMSFATSTTIGDLFLESATFVGTAGYGTIVQGSQGGISRFHIDGLSLTDFGTVWICNSSPTATYLHVHDVNAYNHIYKFVDWNNPSALHISGSAITVDTISTHFVTIDQSSTVTFDLHEVAIPSGSLVNVTATGLTVTVNVNAPSCELDVSNIGTENATGPVYYPVTHLNGQSVYNTNSALGTLGSAGLVLDDGTHWHLMTDPTLVY